VLRPISPSNFKTSDGNTRDDLRRLGAGLKDFFDWIRANSVTSFNGLVGDIIGVASFNGRTGDVMPQAGDYASGSGHPGSWLTDLPDSAHANDNEFDSTTLPSGWGWWKVGAAETPSGTPDPYSALAAGVSRVAYHTDFRRSHVVVQTPADSVERRLVKSVTIPTDAWFWARLGGSAKQSLTDNDSVVSLALYGDSGSAPSSATSWVSIGLQITGSQLQHRFQVISAGALTNVHNVVDQSDAGGRLFPYVGVQKLGTTYHGWLADDAGHALYMGSGTVAGTLSWCGFRFMTANSTNPANPMLAADFFRQQDTATGWFGRN